MINSVPSPTLGFDEIGCDGNYEMSEQHCFNTGVCDDLIIEDSLFSEINVNNGKNLIVGVIYGCPDYEKHREEEATEWRD